MIHGHLDVPSQLERWFRLNGLEPSSKTVINGQDVYLAEGGPDFDVPDMPFGAFISGWAIRRDKMIIGRLQAYSLTHDSEMTELGRKQARLNSARKDAEKFITEGMTNGFFH